MFAGKEYMYLQLKNLNLRNIYLANLSLTENNTLITI